MGTASLGAIAVPINFQLSSREIAYIVKDAGIETILTSGQRDACVDGKELLAALHKQAAGRIHIMCGSGVKPAIIEDLARATGIRCFHMSGSRTRESGMIYRNPNVHMGLKEISEYEIRESDEEQFRQAAHILRQLYG